MPSASGLQRDCQIQTLKGWISSIFAVLKVRWGRVSSFQSKALKPLCGSPAVLQGLVERLKSPGLQKGFQSQTRSEQSLPQCKQAFKEPEIPKELCKRQDISCKGIAFSYNGTQFNADRMPKLCTLCQISSPNSQRIEMLFLKKNVSKKWGIPKDIVTAIIHLQQALFLQQIEVSVHVDKTYIPFSYPPSPSCDLV